MSYNYNRATLVGRLTRPPEIHTINEVKRTTFVLAINRNHKREDGSTNTDFVPVTVWGKLAGLAEQYLQKGKPVLVEGRIHVRAFNKEKETKWITEVIGENIQLLGVKTQILSDDEKS